ncbi:MAG TPA: outer membrane protein assembly factor BamD [Polyangiaceae bacterium]|jgi:outer membrane protein assembly factor BamD
MLPLPARLRLLMVAWFFWPCFLSGCAADQDRAEDPRRYTENARQAYEAALEAFYDHDWEAVPVLMDEVRRKYAYSRYARLAELRIADADFHQGKYAEAITGYKSFVHDYPNDPEIPYARYRVAKAQFDSAGESLLLPPLEERDLATVNDAYASLRSFLSDYPSYEHAVELEYMLEVVRGLLVRHELYVARFYLNRGKFEAAIERGNYALENFQGSGLEPEALVLLGETYLKMKRRKEARTVFTKVLRAYPDSAFVVPARKFLARIEAPEAAP